MNASVPVSLIELVDAVREKYKGRVALQELDDEAGMKTMTYDALARQRSRISDFLMEHGIQKGDRVAMLSAGSCNWGAAFFGIIEIGAVLVPMDVKLKEPEWVNILNHSQAKALVVSKKFEGIAAALKGQAPSVVKVLSLEEHSDLWPSVSQLPAGARASHRRNITDEDTALIVYTSGTTGTPKGVELSCGSLRFEVEAFEEMINYRPDDNFLSILPVNHLFEITGSFLGALYYGCTITYCHSLKPTQMLEAMQRTGTSVMLVVPLVLKMLHDGIFRKVDKLPATQRKLFYALLNLSKQADRAGIKLGKLFFGKLHKEFGGHFRFFVSGGAPLDPELAYNFSAMGFPVLQGYGLTETAPVISGNSLKANRIGSVGKPLPGVEVQILRDKPDAVDGEIIARGPNVMKGYYRNPEATAEVIKEGWFYTGDLGYFDRAGFLFISGRRKNLIVTGGGKKVQPEEVEELFSRTPYIKELCVLGKPAVEGRKTGTEEVYAVIVPNEDQFKANALAFDDATIRKVLTDELAKIGKGLADYKRPVDFEVWKDELPKTATRKVKRLEVKERALKRSGL